MEGKARKTGMDFIAEVQWGMHFCLFYRTQDDLIDILVPYFKAGLENNEFCMWVTSEPLSRTDASESMMMALPDFNKYLKKGQIEIVPYTEWYLDNGSFDLKRVLNLWIDKLDMALSKGYAGMRVAGNGIWPDGIDRRTLVNYEREVNNTIGKSRMLAVCSYPIDTCKASEVIDIVGTHQYVIIKRDGMWELIENSERKRAEEVQEKTNLQLQTLIQAIPDAVFFKDAGGRHLLVNPAFEDVFGFSSDDVIGRRVEQFLSPDLADYCNISDEQVKENTKPLRFEESAINKDGKRIILETIKAPLYDRSGNFTGLLGVGRDITEHKRIEEELRKARDEVEARVRERTAELTKTNEMLQTEITKRRLVEGEISNLLKELKTIFDNIPLGIVSLDTEFTILNVNKFMYDITGLTEKDLKKKLCYETIGEYAGSNHEVNKDICKFCKKNECISTKKPTVIERPLGDLIVKVTTVPQLDDDGDISRFLEIIEDITERRQSEKALLESEERYRKLVEFSPDAIAIYRKGKIVFANFAGAKLLGTTDPEQLVGKAIIDFVHPDYREFVKDRTRKMKEEGKDLPLTEEKLMKLDGSVIDVEVASIPFTYQGQTGTQVIIRDITDRKRVESELREREHSYRTLSENLPGIVYRIFLKKNNRMQFFNNMVRPMTGFTAEELTTGEVCSLYMLIFPEDRTHVITTIKTAIKNNQPFQIEYRLKHKDGGIRYFLERGRPIIGTDEKPVYIDGVIFDITENKRATEQIQEQAALLDKAHDAIEVRDLEHRLIYWSKGAELLYGWSAEEFIGKNPDEFLYKDKEEPLQLIEAKRRILEEGEWIGELSQLTKEGKEIIVVSRWTLVHDSKGNAKSILRINTDITERKRLEAQFLRAQRMESIGTLAGGIAHDLNNVMTPIMLSIDLLRGKLTDGEGLSFLDTIERSTNRGVNLIKQVMSFAQGIEGERVTLQISHFVSEIEMIAKETFPKSIEIRTEIGKDLWTVSGDSTQLHQILMNLCVNARDAMPYGGILTISAENILIDENYARTNIEAKVGPHVIITVSDTGAGIPLGIIDRIFEPFFTTKEPGKGTGLGLSTVLTIVKSHGGFINVYSRVGNGTSFKIHLPTINAIEIQQAEKEHHELPAGHGELILVVDDEVQIREITSKILEEYGYRVIVANDGAEAIALYLQHQEEIEAVLMDMMMPVMEGSASIRALNRINNEVKIIAVSGLIDKDKTMKIAKVNIHAFLTKPYTTERLLKTIEEVLKKK